MKIRYIVPAIIILFGVNNGYCQTIRDTTFNFGNYTWTIKMPGGFRYYSEAEKNELAGHEKQNLQKYNGTGDKGYIDKKIFVAEYSWGNSIHASLSTSTDGELKWRSNLRQSQINTFKYRQQRNPGVLIDSSTTYINIGGYKFENFEVVLLKQGNPPLHILSMEYLFKTMVLHIDIVYKDDKLWLPMKEAITNSKIKSVK